MAQLDFHEIRFSSGVSPGRQAVGSGQLWPRDAVVAVVEIIRIKDVIVSFTPQADAALLNMALF